MPIVVPIGVRKTIENPIDPELKEMLMARIAYVVNVSDQSWLIQRTHGVYVVRAREEGFITYLSAPSKPGEMLEIIETPCKPGDEYTIMMIRPRMESLDHGDERFTEQVNSEKKIALDIAGHCNDQILTMEGHTSFSGVFACETNPPDPKLLADARRKLRAFYRDQVALGDQFHEDPHTHKEITNLMRRSAKVLNLKKPWVYAVESEETCGACGKNVPEGVAICASCGAILDEEKARKFFPERFQVASLPVPDSETGELPEVTESLKPKRGRKH